MRVYEIAKRSGVESKVVREYLELIGQPVKTASANVTGDIFIATLINRLVANKDNFIPLNATPPF